MANKSITMSKIRQIMKLYTQHMGKRKIGERLGISKNTVKLYIDQFYQLKRPWDDLSRLTDFELNKLFHPPKCAQFNTNLKQLYDFFPVMEKQLRKRGMTVAKQFLEYRKLYPDTYGETSFYHYYKKWRHKVNPAMPIVHTIGDKMYVDFAGATLPYVDAGTGEVKESQVFVAVLGWSQYAFVEAMPSQGAEDFISACENALHFFEGVPLALVPDNLKSAVIKSSNYEPVINENFNAFAEHYGITILPARPRKPKDKALVENMVKLTYKEIYTKLPELKILPLDELNLQIRIHLKDFNHAPFSGKAGSRTDQWDMERSALSSLNEKRYEMRKIKQVTVMKNGHVYLGDDQHYYSVPYELIGKSLKMHVSRSTVNVYDGYEHVAAHPRIRSPHNYSTIRTHMPPQHRFITEWNPEFFLERARAIDPVVELFINQVLLKKQYPEQAYKSCQGILSFAKRVGHSRLIKACNRAHEIGYYNYRIVEDILKKNLDQYDEDPDLQSLPSHENIRGGSYYE